MSESTKPRKVAFRLMTMPVLKIDGKNNPCDGCAFIRQGSNDGKKSRRCIAPPSKTAEETGCRISDTERRIWEKYYVEQ